MHFAGINLGHGHVKVQTDQGFFQYPSISQRANDSMASHDMKTRAQRVMVEGVAYDVGEEVELIAERTLDRTVFSNWGDSRTYRVLQQSVLDRLAAESLGPWTIAFGMPVAQFKDTIYRSSVIADWRGIHVTALGLLDIGEALPIPEPLGSFWDYCYASPANRQVLESSEVAIVDFGYFTTDLNAVTKMKLSANVASSINEAMRDVYRHIADRLLRQYRATFTELRIESAVLGRWPLTYKGQPLSLEDPLEEATRAVAGDILSWLRSHIDRSYELILTTGGGAPTMTPFVRAAIADAKVEMVASPQQANARGYYRVARRLGSA